jgi:hypothetical protein
MNTGAPMLKLDTTRLAIVVVVEVEASRPRITTTARTPEEASRLTDWVQSQPSLDGLLRLASLLEAGSTLSLHIEGEDLE